MSGVMAVYSTLRLISQPGRGSQVQFWKYGHAFRKRLSNGAHLTCQSAAFESRFPRVTRRLSERARWLAFPWRFVAPCKPQSKSDAERMRRGHGDAYSERSTRQAMALQELGNKQQVWVAGCAVLYETRDRYGHRWAQREPECFFVHACPARTKATDATMRPLV